MMPERWRIRLTYTAMSLFVAWHALALAVAPLPNSSAVAQTLQPLLHPYLTFFSLDNKWDFYSPEINHGRRFRYIVEDASGHRNSFVPIETLSWYHPNYWWFWEWYEAVMDFPDIYAEHVATLLCQKHAVLKPNSVELLSYQVGDFTPQDYLGGKFPMDQEFVTVTTVIQKKCSDR